MISWPRLMSAEIAVVTGANRGIGLEVVRQLAERDFEVVLASRELARGNAAAQSLGLPNVHVRQLDVGSDDSVGRFAAELVEAYPRLDALVNNAAVLYDTWAHARDADLAVVHEAFETNLFGAWRVVQALLPLLRRSDNPRIVNVSSERGSLASMGGGTPACAGGEGLPRCRRTNERKPMSRKLTTEERVAMKEALKDAEGEEIVLARIAAMSDSDRAMAERVHAIVIEAAPGLKPRTWYGMPAYAKDGKVICFFQDAAKFKARYATFGFSDKANLDDGNMWATSFALTRLTRAEEERIADLVKRAVSR